MSATHFFVGLGAGVAILAVPVLTLTPGLDLPRQFVAWIDGSQSQSIQLTNDNAAATRPQHGYVPGDATPGPPTPPPTLQPVSVPTPIERVQIAPQPLPQALQPSTLGGSQLRTGVIRSGGIPVYVRQVAGVDSGNDPQIPDGSPVLVSASPPLQIGAQQWRAIRGLSGIAGWVPSTQVAVDGETPPSSAPLYVAGAQTTPTPITVGTMAPTPITVGSAAQQATIANTDGVGVVLRKSPNDADRTPTGLMDGMHVAVLERSGADWVHVKADNGLQGWIPAKYVVGGG